MILSSYNCMNQENTDHREIIACDRFCGEIGEADLIGATRMLIRSYWGFRIALLAFASLGLVVSCEAFAEGLRTLTNQELGFTFQYPESWAVQPPSTPNSRAKVISPQSTPHAECAVIVQKYPQLSSLTQGEIDQAFAQKKPSASEFKAGLLSAGYNDVVIAAVSVGVLRSRPAHLVRTQYSVGTPVGKMFVSGRMVSTATPGLTWTITCGGQGRSLDEAEKSYQHWQTVIDNIIFSFQFK